MDDWKKRMKVIELKERKEMGHLSTAQLRDNINNRYNDIGRKWARDELRDRGVIKKKRTVRRSNNPFGGGFNFGGFKF
jgi:hypothetical protein